MNKHEIANFIAVKEFYQVPILNAEELSRLKLAKIKLKIQGWVVLEFNSVTAVSGLNLGSLLPLRVKRWEVGDELISYLNLVLTNG